MKISTLMLAVLGSSHSLLASCDYQYKLLTPDFPPDASAVMGFNQETLNLIQNLSQKELQKEFPVSNLKRKRVGSYGDLTELSSSILPLKSTEMEICHSFKTTRTVSFDGDYNPSNYSLANDKVRTVSFDEVSRPPFMEPDIKFNIGWTEAKSRKPKKRTPTRRKRSRSYGEVEGKLVESLNAAEKSFHQNITDIVGGFEEFFFLNKKSTF